MVFCYKIITESPRRAGFSPRKRSPVAHSYNVPSSLSKLLGTYNYETNSTNILDEIPEREWRLLSALARKREETDEREKLADEFRKLWEREKQERKTAEAETMEQYKRYMTKKRREEKIWLEMKHYQEALESQLKRRQLMEGIRYKERQSADRLAYIGDQKTSSLIDRALEDEARAQLASDRRIRISKAENLKKKMDFIDAQRKSEDARMRRSALLQDASQRAAITNALSSWESSLLRQEVSAMDAMRRANHAAHAALTDARSVQLIRSRDARRLRARRIALVTEQLRDAIRYGKRY